MCGICGIHDISGESSERRERVAAMGRALRHRGPDDQGEYHGDALSLGFRRLAVIDLESGRQPIVDEVSGSVIVLNGEIYNFRELRRELEDERPFRTVGDVEVVLRLYEREGIDGLARLDGMFALALWDERARTLFLARDRFGVKPLFLYQRDGLLAFASELNALLAAGLPASPRLDRLQLRHYLSQRYPSPDASPFEEISSLAPGTILEIAPGGQRRRRFWEAPGPSEESISDEECIERLERLLREAARRQLVADVPVGLFLSGGLDSGTLASFVADACAGKLSTFSVGFDSGDVANELPAAAESARRLGSEHHELLLTPREVRLELDSILASLDGPLGDATVIPTWFMSRFARQRVTVALSGEGADEIFGGYNRQRYDLWLDRVGPWGRRLAPLAMRLAGRRISPALRRRLRLKPGLQRQLDWSRAFGASEIDRLAVEPLASETALNELHAERARQWESRAEQDGIGARLATDRELFLPGDLLPKVDRMSMAHSLESRVPYLDNALVDFAISQPGHRKIRGNEMKWMLRRVAERRLPAAGAHRPKQGFDVPIAAWLREPLREPMQDLLSESTQRRRGLFRPAEVQRLMREHLEGADRSLLLWSLIALEGWLQQTVDRRPAGQPA